jgi:hypothetical protein
MNQKRASKINNLYEYVINKKRKFATFIVNNLKRFIILFYKKFAKLIIMNTKPLKSNLQGIFEVHTLLQHSDLVMYLWAIKSFIFFSKLKPKIVVHDDGTLTTKDKDILKSHINNIEIIDRRIADKLIAKRLKKYKHCLKYRNDNSFIFTLKLFDPFFFSKSNRIMLLDSDIIFFKEPKIIINWVYSKDKNLILYLNDPAGAIATKSKGAFSLDPHSIFKNKVTKYFNAGLLCLQKFVLDLKLLEKYFSSNLNSQNKLWVEQTAYAILFYIYKGKPLDSLMYDVSHSNISIKTIAKHYISPIRNAFFTKGVLYLVKKNFIKDYNSYFS